MTRISQHRTPSTKWHRQNIRNQFYSQISLLQLSVLFISINQNLNSLRNIFDAVQR